MYVQATTLEYRLKPSHITIRNKRQDDLKNNHSNWNEIIVDNDFDKQHTKLPDSWTNVNTISNEATLYIGNNIDLINFYKKTI